MYWQSNQKTSIILKYFHIILETEQLKKYVPTILIKNILLYTNLSVKILFTNDIAVCETSASRNKIDIRVILWSIYLWFWRSSNRITAVHFIKLLCSEQVNSLFTFIRHLRTFVCYFYACLSHICFLFWIIYGNWFLVHFRQIDLPRILHRSPLSLTMQYQCFVRAILHQERHQKQNLSFKFLVEI